MKVMFVTNYGKTATVEIPALPRVGETLSFFDMPEMYDEGNGDSPLWVVTGVRYAIEGLTDSCFNVKYRYMNVVVEVKNREDD